MLLKKSVLWHRRRPVTAGALAAAVTYTDCHGNVSKVISNCLFWFLKHSMSEPVWWGGVGPGAAEPLSCAGNCPLRRPGQQEKNQVLHRCVTCNRSAWKHLRCCATHGLELQHHVGWQPWQPLQHLRAGGVSCPTVGYRGACGLFKWKVWKKIHGLFFAILILFGIGEASFPPHFLYFFPQVSSPKCVCVWG